MRMTSEHFVAQRTCQRKGCSRDLTGYRSDARYCSEACSKAARRAKSPDKGRTRRNSRDGRGAKVYLTFEEIVHIEQARDRLELPETPAGNALDRKLQAAAERITSKEFCR